MKGSKDLNKNDENNHFVKNYKNLWDAMASGMRGSKIPNDNDESDSFAKNDKNMLRAMAWGMRGSKESPTKMIKTTNATIFTKITKKLLMSARPRRMTGCQF